LYKESQRAALQTLSTKVIKANQLIMYKAKITVCSERRKNTQSKASTM